MSVVRIPSCFQPILMEGHCRSEAYGDHDSEGTIAEEEIEATVREMNASVA